MSNNTQIRVVPPGGGGGLLLARGTQIVSSNTNCASSPTTTTITVTITPDTNNINDGGDNDAYNGSSSNNYNNNNSNNNNNKGIELASSPTPLPPPQPLQSPLSTLPQTIKSLPVIPATKIDLHTPNGVRLGGPAGGTYYSKFAGRCQQQLALRGKQKIGSTNSCTVTSTTSTTTTATTSVSAHSQRLRNEKTALRNSRGVDRIRITLNNKRHIISAGSETEQFSKDVVKRFAPQRSTVKTKLSVPTNTNHSSLRISLDVDNSSLRENGILYAYNGHDSIGHRSPRLKSVVNDVLTSCGQGASTNLSSSDRSLKPKSALTHRQLEDRIRAMYSQRRFLAPTSARSFNHRPRSANRGRPHSSRGGRRSASPCPRDDLSDGSSHSTGIVLLAKFRLVARMTIILIRLMKAIIENSNDLTTRSAAELQWLTVYGRDTEATMAFNKNLYSRDRVMTHIPDWAMSILQLEPESRTELHCRRLHALLRGLKSFDKFTDEIQMSLCRAFRLEIVTEGRILLKHGHIGVYFYFIYSGSVFVNAQDKSTDGKPFMRTITVLTRGQSFGELALLQDIKRTATVSVREKCELLVVDKEVFARVCPKIFEKELEEKTNFLSGMSLFPSKWWGAEAMRALSMEAQIQEFKINKVIVPDSSLDDWIYTCIEGKCQVIHCLSLTSKSTDSADRGRKSSDIVLSEEIIDLLSSATSSVAKTNEQEVDADIKEKLLSSLGLDYVASGKRRHAYLKDDVEKERLRAIQGLDEATTLTSLMRKREETSKGLVYLNVGVIEPGEVFDLHSLVRDERDMPNQTSCLMLVSGGAKIIKVRKMAFYEHASDQALEHTRTLASKQRFLSDESLIESYKEKKKWERYKTDVVHSVITTKQTRNQHGLSSSCLSQRNTPSNSRAQTPRPKSHRHGGSRSASARTTSRRSDTTLPASSTGAVTTSTPRRPSHDHTPLHNGIGIDHDADDNDGHHTPTPTDLVINVVQKENQAPHDSSSPADLGVGIHESDNNLDEDGSETLNLNVNVNSNTAHNNNYSNGKADCNSNSTSATSTTTTTTDHQNGTAESRVKIKLKEDVHNSISNSSSSDMAEKRRSSRVPGFHTDTIIIRRNPVRTHTSGGGGRTVRGVAAFRPHTVHPRFSTR